VWIGVLEKCDVLRLQLAASLLSAAYQSVVYQMDVQYGLPAAAAAAKDLIQRLMCDVDDRLGTNGVQVRGRSLAVALH
jgi:hypothetical protein